MPLLFFFVACLAGFCASTRAGVRVIPVPVLAISPNTGSTYGIAPVLLGTSEKEGKSPLLVSPFLTWNLNTRYTAALGIDYAPSELESLKLSVSVSARINRGAKFEYHIDPRKAQRATHDILIEARRDLFYRFFGFGPDTIPGNESGYTLAGGQVTLRHGFNFTSALNFAFLGGFERNLVQDYTVRNVLLTRDLYPDTPGLGGSQTVWGGLSLRVDTREKGPYSESGFYSAIDGLGGYGLVGTPRLSRLTWDTRVIIPQLTGLQGVGRLYWTYTGGRNIPFYDQSQLGGAEHLRGFPTSRFTDKGAWEIDFAERVTVTKLKSFGANVEVQASPFVSYGQVYSSIQNIGDNRRVCAGLELNAVVRPAFVGRLDFAADGEGLKVYTELGYPF